MVGNLSPTPVGVGLKACHKDDVLDSMHAVEWFEVHAENYMGAGGPPHALLSEVRSRYPVSIHGVGLSIGGAEGLDQDHLSRLAAVVDRYQPMLVSEHLAWSTHQGQFFNDLLALPYTAATLSTVCAHIEQVQDRLKREILIENPSTYIQFTESDIDEVDFLRELANRTGCRLLLDVNNLFVSCTNHAWNAESYLKRFPIEAVGEVHLAGHAEERRNTGDRLLIDAHDRAVSNDVWMLYRQVVAMAGSLPTLIEWDNDVPAWADLESEGIKARDIMNFIDREERTRRVA